MKWAHFKEIKKNCPKCGASMHLGFSIYHRGKNNGHVWLHDDFNQFMKCHYTETVDNDTAYNLLKVLKDE